MGETTSRRIERLRGEIEAWRHSRYERAPLPARLWSEAVAAAQELGVNRARIALGLSHRGLQAHVDRVGTGPNFVELSGAEVLAAGPSTACGTSIEINVESDLMRPVDFHFVHRGRSYCRTHFEPSAACRRKLFRVALSEHLDPRSGIEAPFWGCRRRPEPPYNLIVEAPQRAKSDRIADRRLATT